MKTYKHTEGELSNRIAHLKQCEMEYFDKSCDHSIPKVQREIYRVFSREFEARRKELELLEPYELPTEGGIRGKYLVDSRNCPFRTSGFCTA